MKVNEDYDRAVIENFRAEIGSRPYLEEDPEENTDEFVQFRFLGKLEDREVIFSTAMYTLRLHHESEVFDIAEQKARKQFPNYKRINWGESDSGDESVSDKESDSMEEQIGLFMAEVILELEEEGTVKVQEHVDMDVESGVSVSLDVGLNLAAITPEIIETFIGDFNADTLKLDKTLYSFQSHDDGD
jgi:hypothetical protein